MDTAIGEASEAKDLIVSALPAQFVKLRIREIAGHLKETAIVLSASKRWGSLC